jgi:hydrogenase small subunit
MRLDRRDFLKASAALGGALTLKSAGLLPDAMAATGPDAPPVVWLQGQSCTGCSVSFLNSIYYTTAEDLLLNQLDVKFQSNVMAAAGDLAVEAATSAQVAGGYVLILEGSIPFGDNGEFCHLWENTSMVDAVQQFAPGAAAIIALGTCAAYGGIIAGTPNPTDTLGVKDALAALGINKPIINIPGCPMHPDWLVGTVATLLNGQMPTLDEWGRPIQYYPEKIHDNCPMKPLAKVFQLGQVGCMKEIGCKGPKTWADCHYRKWNSGAAGQYGQEWCIGAGNPCLGCTEPKFPDGMSPFYNGLNGGDGGTTTETITIKKAEYRPDKKELRVEATSTRQPEAVLTLAGYGQMTWLSDKNLYQFRKEEIAQPSGTITVSSSFGGSATTPVTVVVRPDTVTIQKAVYKRERRELLVEATSSKQPNAVLTVVDYGQMNWLNAKNYYRYRKAGVAQPSSITVSSSLGGSATKSIIIRR